MMTSCHSYKPWSLRTQVSLKGISPIGITQLNDHLWISDGDHNRMVKATLNGQILDTIYGFDRPMHIASYDGKLYVPNYGSDNIVILEKGLVTDTLHLNDSLDAPSGISILGDEIAIADFYNHRILFFNGIKWLPIGREGHEKGELYYPTDVQLFKDKIYVADAYNNRIQIFNKNGQSIQTIGEDDNMNASTGIFIANENELYVTDFEHNKVKVYNGEGKLIQRLQLSLEKPIDLIKTAKGLMVINYKGKTLNIYKQ